MTQCTLFAAAAAKCGIPVSARKVEGLMSRRSRHTPNTSESTGKIGQELPSNQLRPLVPLYLETSANPTVPGTAAARVQLSAEARPAPQAAEARGAPPNRNGQPSRSGMLPSDSGRFELETQPEMPSVILPSRRQPSARPRPPRATWCWPLDSRLRQDDLVPPARRHAAFERFAAQYLV